MRTVGQVYKSEQAEKRISEISGYYFNVIKHLENFLIYGILFASFCIIRTI